MNELHLFAGSGGGILGGVLLGHTCVCAVEIEPYCQEVLLHRQRDGILPRFPIWGDIKSFNGKPWRGLVDILCGGYPCQGFSNAAAGRNIPEKDLSHEFVRIVSEVLPAHILGENVSRSAVVRVCEDLRDLGYICRFGKVSARMLGADHDRPRWWFRAYSDLHSKLRRPLYAKVAVLPKFRSGVWETFPDELRMVDGVAHRMDRIKATGNGQVPLVAATAWNLLKPISKRKGNN